MTDWSAVPVFGSRTHAAPSVVRPSAYGMLADPKGRLALVRTPNGVFLPGGGIEDQETVELAIRRELIEECGLVVRVLEWRVHSVQFVVSQSEGIEYEKHCTFRQAVLAAGRARRTEADHELLWRPPGAARLLLSHASQRWAVERWCEQAGITLP